MDYLSILGITAAVALAEMGDKTQLLTLFLSNKYKNNPISIVCGILCATIVNHFLAAWFGKTLSSFFSGTLFQWILGLSFVAIGLWLLIPDEPPNEDKAPAKLTSWKVFTMTTGLFFMAEMGDKTQIATVMMGARYNDVVIVTLGTTLGMMAANVPAIWLGQRFTHILPVAWVHRIAALLFIGMGMLTLLKLYI